MPAANHNSTSTNHATPGAARQRLPPIQCVSSTKTAFEIVAHSLDVRGVFDPRGISHGQVNAFAIPAAHDAAENLRTAEALWAIFDLELTFLGVNRASNNPFDAIAIARGPSGQLVIDVLEVSGDPHLFSHRSLIDIPRAP